MTGRRRYGSGEIEAPALEESDRVQVKSFLKRLKYLRGNPAFFKDECRRKDHFQFGGEESPSVTLRKFESKTRLIEKTHQEKE